MLAPADQKWRRSYLAHAIIARAALHRHSEELDEIVQVPVSMLASLAEHSASEIFGDGERRKALGQITGRVVGLYFSLALLNNALHASDKEHFKSCIGEVCSTLSPQKSNSWFDNKVWPLYRRAAHLWAASNILSAPCPQQWPCLPADLLTFLALAHRIEQFCGEHRLPRQNTSFIDSADLWRVDASLFGLKDEHYEAAVQAFGAYWRNSLASSPAV